MQQRRGGGRSGGAAAGAAAGGEAGGPCPQGGGRGEGGGNAADFLEGRWILGGARACLGVAYAREPRVVPGMGGGQQGAWASRQRGCGGPAHERLFG